MQLPNIFSRTKAMPVKQNGVMIMDGNYSPLAQKAVTDIIREGYAENAIVKACVQQIANGAGIVKLELHRINADGSHEVVDKHPILQLLERPNPVQTGASFIAEMVTYHRVTGEAFILRLPEKGKPAEIYNLDPRYVQIEKPAEGYIPKAYTYGNGGDKKRYSVNALTGASQVKHIRTINPLDPWRGLSPIISCAAHVDIHNCGAKWNAKLLENSAKPSGILEIAGTVGENTLSNLKNYFKRAWQGTDNAGDIAMLTGGAKYVPLSHSPKDMDFKASMLEAAKNIALVYGVPLPLVSTEASTYANLAEAKEALWGDTILPLLDEVLSALGDFLLPMYEGDKASQYVLTYNPDSIPAMEAKRTRLYERMVKAVAGGLLTPNEARAEMGFDDIDGASDLMVPTSLAPLGGNPTTLVRAMKKAGMKAKDISDVLDTL